jgi:hypothetical protein
MSIMQQASHSVIYTIRPGYSRQMLITLFLSLNKLAVSPILHYTGSTICLKHYVSC